MDRDRATFGVDDPDETRSSREIVGDLRVNLAGAIRGREDFDREIGGAPEEPSAIRGGNPPIAREKKATIAQDLAKAVGSNRTPPGAR